jgi:uncharacterized protein
MIVLATLRRGTLLWLMALLGLGGLPTSLALAQSVLAVPALSARVIDQTGTLRAEQVHELEARLQTFEQTKGTQIVVLMVPTTAPEDIVDYTQRVADAWKIGRKEVGDGLLVVIAKNDRSLRIATSKTLEGAVPDLAARQVIDRAMTPRFREGDFAGGIEAGLDQLMALVRGEKLPEPQRVSTSTGDGSGWVGLFALFFFVIPPMARFLGLLIGRKAAALLTGVGVGALAWLISASVLIGVAAALVASLFALASSLAVLRRSAWGGHRNSGGWAMGSGSWSGGSQGGFRSGGGGNFGGGGASGRW